jgi:hypothetical protein
MTALALYSILIANAPAEDQVRSRVLSYASQHVGQMVGSGECAELADEALKAANAKAYGSWADSPQAGDYVWGKKLATLTVSNLTVEPNLFLPGDIIQIRDAKFVEKAGPMTTTYTASQHTAIIEHVLADNTEITLLEQNSNGKRYVTRKTIRLNTLKAGTIWVYRAQPR